MAEEKIKVEKHSEELKNLREYIRSIESDRAFIYDYFGRCKGTKSLPLYYSDTLKFCYPECYFTQKQVLRVVEKTKQYIEEKNYDVSVDYSEKYWIGGLHCHGYKLKLILN